MTHTNFLISIALSQPPKETIYNASIGNIILPNAHFFHAVMESGRLFPSQDPRLSRAKLYWHFLIYILP